MTAQDEDQPPRQRRRIRDLAHEDSLRHKRRLADSVGRGGLWPMNAPGMPPPGPNFLREADALGDNTEFAKATKKEPGVYKPGDTLTKLYKRALRQPGFTLTVDAGKCRRETVTFVPGHIWGQHAQAWTAASIDPNLSAPLIDGPHPADVMILGKMPWKEEISELRNLVGPSGEIVAKLVDQFHIKGARKWYVTNLVKFMPPEGNTRLSAGWIKDCLPLLHQELRIVRPKYILCLGADASKSLLGDKFNVGYMAGRVVPFTYPVQLSPDDDKENHTSYVMTVLHPAEVARSPEKIRILESNFGRFAYMVTGGSVELEEKGLDHRVCMTLEDAIDWIHEVEYELSSVPKKDRLLAWDLEWEGQHPINEGSYVRTIQCSWGHKKAIVFVIKHPGGKTAFRDREGRPAIKRLVKALNKFVPGTRTVGHFLVSDLEWAEHLGLHLVDHCPVPLFDKETKSGERIPAWKQLANGSGWLCTGMMNHAIEETAPLGLEMLTMRYTTAPRYDIPLEDWKTQHCAERKIKKEALEGYGKCPDKTLLPYSLYDADVSRRIVVSLMPLLEFDYDGNNCWEAFWESMITQTPILHMHQNGMCVDKAAIDDQTLKFIKWRKRQERKIVNWAKWEETETSPRFNIRSVQHVKEFLFGESLNGKRGPNNETIRIRPKGAKSLYIQPLLDTSKPQRRWADLVERGLDRDASPSTAKMVLGILAEENPNVADEINMIRDYRFLDQALKSFLRPPTEADEDHYVEGDDGFLEYEFGIAGSIDDDGRVRTNMSPTTETGRFRHRRPNLANVSKSRDPDYTRLLGGVLNPQTKKWEGGDYTQPLRSILIPSPGFAMLEKDYIGAELYLAAVMSGSKAMQDHCLRSTLPDKGYDAQGQKVAGGKLPHPNYYDIHSNVAVLAFRLKCPPTKDGLDSIGKQHYRTLAKNVIFGLMYGRQAKAIALQAREQGIKVTPDEAQLVIDAIFDMYPELQPFFDEAKSRSLNERWLCNCFGRFRRFPRSDDYKLEGEFERQAMNFPIQSGIASCVDRALAYFDHEVRRQGLQNDIRPLLQIHDALLIEARYDQLQHASDLLDWAMCSMVEIWPTDLAGVPRGDGPYRLGVDTAVYKAWSLKFSKVECEEHGIPLNYAGK